MACCRKSIGGREKIVESERGEAGVGLWVATAAWREQSCRHGGVIVVLRSWVEEKASAVT